jgi:hypothetical protein
MWPFKEKSKALTEMLNVDVIEAESLVAGKWLIFQKLQFEDSVSLETKIQLFMDPALEGIVSVKPVVAFMPTELVMLIFANGIIKTQTHTALEVQDALGIPRAEP